MLNKAFKEFSTKFTPLQRFIIEVNFNAFSARLALKPTDTIKLDWLINHRGIRELIFWKGNYSYSFLPELLDLEEVN